MGAYNNPEIAKDYTPEIVAAWSKAASDVTGDIVKTIEASTSEYEALSKKYLANRAAVEQNKLALLKDIGKSTNGYLGNDWQDTFKGAIDRYAELNLKIANNVGTPEERSQFQRELASIESTIDLTKQGVVTLTSYSDGADKQLATAGEQGGYAMESSTNALNALLCGNGKISGKRQIMVAPNKEKSYLDSLVARMMSIDDLIQICELKAQQMIQRMMPDGYFIDEDALAEVDLGEGQVLKPQSLLDMFFQTGSIIGRSYTSGGEYNYAKMPVTELNTAGNLQKLQALRTERDSYRNDQREVIGLNKASDASTPDKDSLVGLQKLASLNSNTATRHILDASKMITKRTAEAITYRISDILKYFPELKKDLIRKIGATSVEDLSAMEDLHLRDFSIYLDLDLDDEERAQLDADMTMAIEKGYLALADKYRVLNIKNFKQAVGYMAILMDKFAKKQQKMKQEDATQLAEANATSAERAEQARQQTEQLIGQIKSQVQEITNQGLIEKEKVKGAEERTTLQVKLEGEMGIAQLNGNVAMNKFNELEDRKDERVKKQATLQSELITQRQRDEDPKDFEQEDEGMENFELEED